MSMFSYTKELEPLPAAAGIEILGTVGRSRTFRIYKARRGTKYVILKAANADDAMALEILRREYELACDLYHPSIARTLGFEEQTPVGAAILMEYVEGEPLDEFLALHPSRARRRAVLQDILDGVEYLHRRDIIHNDLKPANILVTRTGTARIIDFGLSASNDSVYRGCLGGTDGYSAPEILHGEAAAEPVSDIYAIGRLIDCLFDGRSYRRVVRRCTAPDPAERPRDIRSLRRLLRRCDRMPWIGAMAAVALLAVGLLLRLSANLQADVEQQIEQQVVTYGEQRADSLEQLRTQRIEALQRDYDRVFGTACRATLAKVQEQSYRELAQVFTIPYYRQMVPYFDSICSRFPIRPDGSIPEELVAIGQVFNTCHRTLDSAVNRLPSIETLPATQRDSLWRVIEQLSEQIVQE